MTDIDAIPESYRDLLEAQYATLATIARDGRYLEIRGDAQIKPDDDYEFASRLGAKYGADMSSFDPPGDTRLEVTVKPVRVNGVTIF